MAALAPLSTNAAASLRVLLERRAATRPELSTALGVTKQTVSLAITELERRRLVEAVAVQQGVVGRSAVRYGIHQSAGWVVGLDLGSARLRLVAVGVDGTLLDDRVITNPTATADRSWPDRLKRAEEALDAMLESLTAPHGALLAVGLAVPHPSAAQRERGRDDVHYETWLTSALRAMTVEVVVENDVNCEAFAQLSHHPESMDGVLHLHVGVGVGTAFVVHGQVLRGARGRAGEIRDLPSPLPERGPTVETALGAGGLLASAGHSSGARLSGSIDDLFAAAALGDDAAETALADEAAGIAALVAQVSSVLDPDLVVLSGQLGGRADLSEMVIERCASAGMLCAVVADPLGDAAAARGAAALALSTVVAQLTGRR